MTHQESPLCECHGEPMLWSKRTNRASGGQWNCRAAVRRKHARYNTSAKGRRRGRYFQRRRDRETANQKDRALIASLLQQLREV